MSESDREKCFTCGLWWGGRGSHPPCLKLTPEERRELGAYAVTGRVVEPPEETTYGDYQAARKA